VIAEPTEQPLSLLTRSGFLERMGRQNLFDSLDEALLALRDRHRVEPPLEPHPADGAASHSGDRVAPSASGC
jgi:hypothetical protein